MLYELQELASQVRRLFPFIWLRCEGYFKGSPLIKNIYLAYLKVVLWYVFAIYGLFAFMVYWAEEYSRSRQTSKMELFAKLFNN